MRQNQLSLFAFACSALLPVFAVPAIAAESKTPLEVVRAYADAANRGDLEAFLMLYAPNIRKFKFPDTKVSEGLQHMRDVYTRSFAEKKGIHVEIVSALALGDKVVCHDHVTGLPHGETADELTVYQVEHGLITNIVYVDKVVAAPATP